METTEIKKFRDIMLDLETMGNESFSAILSIGALEFDIMTGETGREFYCEIDLQSCMDLGLITNASTIIWWLKQSDEARKCITKGDKIPIKQALDEFSKFCDKSYNVWGNSPRFDCGILQNAYNKAGIPIPWDFRKEKCLRTLVGFMPSIKENAVMVGTQHNALADCYYQVHYCHKTCLALFETKY
jgi:hypothetical protein